MCSSDLTKGPAHSRCLVSLRARRSPHSTVSPLVIAGAGQIQYGDTMPGTLPIFLGIPRPLEGAGRESSRVHRRFAEVFEHGEWSGEWSTLRAPPARTHARVRTEERVRSRAWTTIPPTLPAIGPGEALEPRADRRTWQPAGTRERQDGTGRDRTGPRDLEGPVVLWSRD